MEYRLGYLNMAASINESDINVTDNTQKTDVPSLLKFFQSDLSASVAESEHREHFAGRTDDDVSVAADRPLSGHQNSSGHTDPKPTLKQVINKAVETLVKADEKEKENQTLEAFKLYKEGIGLLLTAYKDQTHNPKGRQKIRTKAEIFLKKAEHLKEHLDLNENSDDCALCGPNQSVSRKKMENSEFFEKFILDDSFKKQLDEVKGQSLAVQTLKECLILPLKFPQLFTGRYALQQRGILLFGHPGTGKSMITAAVAGELSDFTFIRMSVWDLTSKYISGTPERTVRQMFCVMREKAPCVLLLEDIDQVDAMEDDVSEERRHGWRIIRTEIMVQLESLRKDALIKENKMAIVFVSQKPWLLSGSMRRRLDKRIFFDLPSKGERMEILKSGLTGVRHKLTAEDFDQLGDRTLSAGGCRFTQADLVCLCRSAMMQSVKKIQEAQFFKQVAHPDSGEEGFWTPCCHGNESAVEMSWTELEGKKVLEPEIEMSDVLHCLQKSSGTVDSESEARMQQWVEDFTSIRS